MILPENKKITATRDEPPQIVLREARKAQHGVHPEVPACTVGMPQVCANQNITTAPCHCGGTKVAHHETNELTTCEHVATCTCCHDDCFKADKHGRGVWVNWVCDVCGAHWLCRADAVWCDHHPNRGGPRAIAPKE